MPVEKEKQGVPSFIEAGSRFWERVNSSAERRQQVLTVGSPKQIVIEEGKKLQKSYIMTDFFGQAKDTVVLGGQ